MSQTPTALDSASRLSEKTAASPRADVSQEQEFPKNRLSVVFIGLMGCSFLSALDQTIVATALPTIVQHLGDGKDYSWVGTAYLLGSASLSPLWGKLSDILGRKIILYTAIGIFLVTSALCGAAKTLTWLIICRAIQGVGGGAIYQLVQIIISDIVPLKDRALYNGYVAMAWGIASVIGPLVGGVFADKVTWRWIFYINLPFGSLSAAILFFTLNLNKPRGKTVRQHIQEFDFLGLLLVVGGVVCILIGFNNSEVSWSSAETIALLAVGGCLLVAFAVNELLTNRAPIIAPRLFKARAPAICLYTNFLHAVGFFSTSYYLPVYFQVIGNSATGGGVRMLPYCLGAATIALISGQFLSRCGIHHARAIMWWSWFMVTLGYGLMIQLSDRSNDAEKEIYPLVAAAGIGCLFTVPLIELQRTMPVKDLAISTGAFGFLRLLGGTIGISIGQAILSSTLRKKVATIPGLTFDTSPAALSQGVRQLQNIADPVQRSEVIHAYSTSISEIWLALTPILGSGLVCVLFLRKAPVQRDTPATASASQEYDTEKGVAGKPAGLGQTSLAGEDASATAIVASSVPAGIRSSLG